MNCTSCKGLIPPERLEAVPDATMCVKCQSQKGDVPKKKGVMVYYHKTGGEIQVVSDSQLQKMKELPGEIDERVSRL